ncbi:choice-of-anchor L domain-containing protein [Bacillus sp. RIT 809]|uniref:choice-of-anchor L domain-containing protein n=1 Tax=Bacillus sp. RIT 809 TaxID=2803857 RepID=UPI00194FF2B3|nr:choice-of-anchor L domain-containing protein [Bacillus sp. RIT 809]MBM6644520.1 choice-of-anchor L domain-containing protein [Bacillus sp. RIT 809]
MGGKYKQFKSVLTICIVAILCLQLPGFYVKANGEETIKEDRKFEIKSIQEAGKSNNPDISVSTLDDNVKAEQLAKKLVGDGVEIRNVKYKGANQAAGTVQAKQNIFGIEEGVILSTGNVKGIIGPNKYKSYTQINNQPGDSDLEKILGNGMKTFDASVLEFEFKPLKEIMNVQYVLASDEYEEFSNYSDALGVFINERNIALADSWAPVSTSTINNWVNRDHNYISNTNGARNTEMDGMTKVLDARSNVKANDWNKLKLVIADGKDNGVDSNVLIKPFAFEDIPSPVEYDDVAMQRRDVVDISADKSKFIVGFVRHGKGNKELSIDWKVTLPKNATSSAEVKNQGKVVFGKDEFEKTIEIEVNKQDRDLQFSFSGKRNDTASWQRTVGIFMDRIIMTPERVKLKFGEEQVYKVIAKYRDETEEDITDKIKLEANKHEIVEVNSGNKIIGRQAGVTSVTAQYGNMFGWSTVEVEKTLKDIELERDNYVLVDKAKGQILVRGVYEGGLKEEIRGGLNVTSSNEKVVRILDLRTFEAVGEGEAVLTVEYGGFKKNINVTVKKSNRKLTQMHFYPAYENRSRVMTEGSKTQLTLLARYDDGYVEEVTRVAEMVSANPEVAGIEFENEEMYLIGKGVGETVIKVSYKDFKFEEKIKVEKRVEELLINKNQINLKEGVKEKIVVKAKYNDGEKDVTDQTNFWINDGDIARIENNGEIRGLKQGQATLVANYKNHEVRVPIYIENGLKDIEFEESNITLRINGMKKIQVISVYEENYRFVSNKEATFSSNNDNVKVDKFGNIVAQKEGESIITVSVRDIKKEVKVKVENPLVALQVGTKKIALKTKEVYELKVTGLYEDGSLKDVTKSVNFKSSNSSVVEVDASGKLIAQDKKGTATVTITKDKQSLNIPVEVTEKETGLLLEVQDGNGRGMDSVNVVLEDSKENKQKLITGSNGTLSLKPQEGAYKVYVYKKGYKPVSVDVVVKNDERTKQKVILEPSQLFDGKMNVTQMSKEEIEKAGIDVNHPDNRHVYKFELHLKIDNEDKKVDYIINNVGKIIQGNLNVSIGSGASEVNVYPVVIQNERFQEKEAPPAVGYMVVPGKVSWLKEFFKVEVMIQSFADEPFELTNTNISLKLPEGLSLAPISEKQSETIHLGAIGGNEVKKAEWYIRGDKKGEYHLGANFSSTLYPFDEPLSAEFKTAKPIEVYGEDGVKMHIKVDKKAYKGLPYVVKVGIENKSPNVIYDLHVELNEADKKNFVYTPGTELKRVVNSIQSGETVWLDYLLLPKISGDLNMGKSFIKKVGDGINIETVLSTIDE